MFMIELPLDAARLMRFAHHQGHGLAAGEDFGYATHAWLTATLGDLAPKPFRLMESRHGLRMLGYAQHSIEALIDYARAFADPNAVSVCDWSGVAGKAMPATWHAERRLGFELRACPISRAERERDIYLVSIGRAEAAGIEMPSRPQVYVEWLGNQLGKDGAAKLCGGTVDLIGFQRIRSRRLGRTAGGTKRQIIERPDALLSGDLTIGNPDAFSRLLLRGIGRHRAFGFGMLLLRPPRQTG